VADVLVDGSSVGAVTSYTFTNVMAGHTIAASFAGDTYTITFNAGSGGTIDLPGIQTVNYNGSTSPVNATASRGYSFVNWTGTGGFMSTSNPLTISNPTSNITITANFRQESTFVTRTVRFIAGQGGRVDGDARQTVIYGENSSPVMAVPEFGYEFAGWTGDYTGVANPLTITNVTSDMTVTANFELLPVTYTVNFISGTGGRIDGNSMQIVEQGGSCLPVKALPGLGYKFDRWIGDYAGEENPLTITNVTSDMTVTAKFTLLPVTYNVSFIVDSGGDIDGDVEQTVSEGGDCMTVKAVPVIGYVFIGWSGDYAGMENPLTINGVTANMTIYANFRKQAAVTFTVSFSAGAGGRIDGNPIQTVATGEDCSSVRAVAEPGYYFKSWSGDHAGAANPLTIAGVISDMTINAVFEENTCNLSPEKPVLIAPVDNAVVPSTPFMLQSGPYSDLENDPHASTGWGISMFNCSQVLYSEISGTDLTSHEVMLLDEGLKYAWRAGYQDMGSGDYTWSDSETFIVGQVTVDENTPPVVPGIDMAVYRMISFILWAGPSAEELFGPLLGEGGYDTAMFRIGTYDPTYGNGGYREYPDFTLEPGQPCWFLARDGLNLRFEGVPVSTSVDICIPLKYNTTSGNGWNMVAPPNDRDYRWGDLQVVEKDSAGNTVSGPTAISQLSAENKYIDVRIFGWDAGAYTASTLPEFLLERYSGYWVRVKQPNVYLCFPVDAGIAARSGGMKDSMLSRLTAWVGSLLPETDTACATASTDAPPMPMAGLNTEEKAGGSGGGGCFIDTIGDSGDSSWTK
jgi:uncharacterized repeat protein (TIGR02543 family)